MSKQMPSDIQELLTQLNNEEDYKRISTQWHEYAQANEAYERTYPMQFGNLVEGNLKFKQDKQIPTPSEQMRDYNELIRDEINQKLHERSYEMYPEPELELPEVEEGPDKALSEMKTNFEKDTPGTPNQPVDKQPDDFLKKWVKDYYSQQAKHMVAKDIDKGDKAITNDNKHYTISEFKLTFGTYEQEMSKKNEGKGIEKVKDDREIIKE